MPLVYALLTLLSLTLLLLASLTLLLVCVSGGERDGRGGAGVRLAKSATAHGLHLLVVLPAD